MLFGGEPYPGHGHEHGGGQVDGEDEGAQGAGDLDLEPIDRVVTWSKIRECF